MTIVNTKVRANVTVIDILSISETEGMFEMYFVVQLMWKDVLAKYVNIKDDENNPSWLYMSSIFLLYAVGYPVGHTAVIGLFSKSTYFGALLRCCRSVTGAKS